MSFGGLAGAGPKRKYEDQDCHEKRGAEYTDEYEGCESEE